MAEQRPLMMEQDPWNRKRHDQPPGLDELLQKWIGQFKKKSSGHGQGPSNSFGQSMLLYAALIVLVALWLISGVFVVDPADRAVVLQFGQYHETLGPGIHWAPRGVQQWAIVNIEQIKQYNYQSEMLTRDENYAVVDVAVMYRISEPEKYLFHARDPQAAFQHAVASSLRQVVGQTNLEAILTTGRAKVRAEIESQLNDILELYNMGIVVTDVKLQDAKPPARVIDAFDDAIKAREDKQRYINKAQAYSNAIIPAAKGQALRITNDAEAAKQQVLLEAYGKTAPFSALLVAYRNNPQLTKKRLYLDTMARILAGHPTIVTSSKNNLLYMPLQEMLKGKDIVKQMDTGLSAQAHRQEGRR